MNGTEPEIENSNYSKLFIKIKYIVGAIFLSIISTAIWESFFRNFVSQIGNYVVNLVSFFYTGYIDSLYMNVGNGGNGFDFLPAIMIIAFFIFFGPFYLLHLFLFKNGENALTVITKDKVGKILFLVIVIIPSMIMFSDRYVKGSSIIRTNGSISKNIEIIHPYITENEFLILRSKLRQIDSKTKTVELIRLIDNVAKKNKIKLGEYNLYGIPN